MDYVLFIIFILIIVALFIFLRKDLARAKNKYKKNAYRLLETDAPASKEIKDTVKCLQLYFGRRSKDGEAAELIKRLMDKLEQLPK
jgi:hypothetical protein